MKKINIIYIIIVMLLVSTPGLLLNIKTNAISEMDNTYYPEWPSKFNDNYINDVDNYIKNRIGFRNEAIYLYTQCLTKIFKETWPNRYMIGKEGYIYAHNRRLDQDYQKINQAENKELSDALVNYFSAVTAYLEKKGIQFLVFFVPEKHTIYPEYMPQYIKVYNAKSNVDCFFDNLNMTDVPYIYPKELFINSKGDKQLYNKKYDPNHWNDLGNLLGNQQIDIYFRQNNEYILPLEETQFDLKYENRKYLLQSYFEVNEDVPVYYIKNTDGVKEIEEDKYLDSTVINYWEHYINENNESAPRILIFHDSFFGDSTKYYIGRYKEVITVHATNYDKLFDLVEHYQPDIVLFESTEQVTYTGNELWNVDKLKGFEKLTD